MKIPAAVISGLVLTAIGMMQVQAQTPPPGLVGYWKGEGNVTDSVGTNNGYVSPSLLYVPGHSGQAFDLWEGIVTAPDAANLKPTNITVQTWVKGVAPGTFRYILAKARGANSQAYALYTGGADVGAAFFVNLANGGGTVLSPSAGTNIWDNNWHQLTGTFDGSTVRLYVDGVEAGTGMTTTNVNGIDYATPGPLILGDYITTRGLPFVGSLDEVKIFDHALTVTDVSDTFSNPSSAATTNGLVTWYKAEGNTLDSWSNNHGTASPPRAFSFASGKAGQAFYPQGSGAAWIADAPELQPTNLTVQLWAKSVSPATFRYLVNKWRGVNGGGFNNSYALYTANGAGAAFLVNLQTSGNDVTVLSPSAANSVVWDGAYHLITGTWDGSVSRLYVDGFEVGAGTTNTSLDTVGIDYSLSRQLIFGNYQGPPGLPFTGMEDEIQLYDRALSSSEILTYFTGTNLVSWWNANSSANDAIGSNHGTLSGAATYAAPRTTVGKSFNTLAGTVAVPDSASLQPAKLTLQAEVSGISPGTNKYIISKSFTASSASYALYTGPDGGLQFYVTVNGGGKVVSPDAGTSVWDGRFHLVDGTYDGQTVRLYVDGKEVGSGTAASGAIQYGTTQNSGQLLFGDFTSTAGGANFTGLIDEVKLYKNALSAQEVDANAFKPFLVVTPPQSQSVAQGTDLNLAITAQGPAPINYQWQLNGTNLPGATSSALVVSNIQPAQAGQYRVALSGGGAQYTNSTVTPGGRAIRSGASGLIDVGNSPAFETDNFTVQAYARAINPGTFKYVFSKSRHPTFYSASYGLYTGSTGGAIFFVVLDGSTFAFVTAEAGTNVWDGNWHQFTGTWDGQFLSFYVDGTLTSSVDSFGGTITYAHDFLNGDLLLGDVLSPNSQFHFPGDYDEVKYFDHALSPDDVMASYTDPNNGAGTNGLVSWYKLDNTALDSWGSNHGSVVPAPVSLISDAANITVAAIVSPTIITNSGVVGGSFQGTVTGPSGQTYVVQRSSDLINWTPIHTNTVPFTFTDSVAGGNGSRFYRAKSQ